ncbi:MAG: ABC transporter ATP-binding protein/permease [Solobacterium sp.]|nr:ABC transporter ATP-binding protein/permease [Solobacterium sp.]
MFDKRLMQMCPESRRYIIGNILMQWLELAMNACMTALVALTLLHLWDRNWGMADVIKALLGMAVTVVVRYVAVKTATHMSYMASRTIKRVMREEIYRKLLNLGVTYRDHVTSAELVQESVEGVEQLESYFGQYVPQFFYAFIAPITLFFLFGIAGSWSVGTVLLICVPLIPGAIMMVQKIAKKLLSKYWDQYAQLGSTFLENLQGMTTLKIYQADAYKNEEMNRESEHFRRITMKVLTMQLNSIIIMDFVAYGGAALGILLATRAFNKGTISLFSVIFMILLSAEFFLPMRKLGSYFHVAMNGMAASDKIFRFLNEPSPEPRTAVLNHEGGTICLAHVNFSYNEEREVLHDVTLELPQAGFSGIVGESGSGKSTIASLIIGRLSPNTGEVSIGGIPLSTVSERSLLDTVTYVGLGSVFFKGTVRSNLLIGDPNASDKRLWEVLEECGLAGFLNSENGLETKLMENAENLSGGQRQRLALARALLHDSPIYIFDEATSNIDIESEELILKKIQELSSTKTVVMITHRLANVKDAKTIYCIENGTIAGHGTHEELLRTCKTYETLWNTQQELEQFGKEGGSR